MFAVGKAVPVLVQTGMVGKKGLPVLSAVGPAAEPDGPLTGYGGSVSLAHLARIRSGR